jgi:hypothetical protein
VRKITIIPVVSDESEIALFPPPAVFEQTWRHEYMPHYEKHLMKVRDAADVSISLEFHGSTADPVRIGPVLFSDPSNVYNWMRDHPEICDRCGDPATRSPTAADLCLFAHPKMTTPRFGGNGLVVIEQAAPRVQPEPFHTLVHEINHGMLGQHHDKLKFPSGQVSTYGNPYSVMGASDTRVRNNKNAITGVAHLLAAGLLVESDVTSLGNIADGEPVTLAAFDEGRAAGRAAGRPMAVRLFGAEIDPSVLLYVSYRALPGVVVITYIPRMTQGYSTSSSVLAVNGIDDTANPGLRPGNQMWLPSLDVVITVDAAVDHSSLSDDQILANIKAGVTDAPTATVRFNRISSLTWPPASCGNGRRDGVEMCDGGDMCDSTCRCTEGSRPGGSSDRGCVATTTSCSGSRAIDVVTNGSTSSAGFTPTCVDATVATATPWLAAYNDTRSAFYAAPYFSLRTGDETDGSSLDSTTIAIIAGSVAAACLLCVTVAGCVVFTIVRSRRQATAARPASLASPPPRTASRRRTRHNSSMHLRRSGHFG